MSGGPKSKDASEGSGGPGRRFYLILAAAVVGGAAALVLAGGTDEPVQPLRMADVDVEADPAAAVALGPEDAPVTVAEFSDFTCPHCARYSSLSGRMIKQHHVAEGRVRYLFYDFPLSLETNAVPAALAARCAVPQDRFWDMQALVLARQREWAGAETPGRMFRGYAEEIGLDVGAWRECYSEGRFLDEVLASRRYGEQRGVNATPTIFINDRRAGDYGYETLESLIQEELAEARGR